ncbi:MAG: hypothetical protein Q9227_003435 [Pyrenula ochraceoflavens]
MLATLIIRSSDIPIIIIRILAIQKHQSRILTQKKMPIQKFLDLALAGSRNTKSSNRLLERVVKIYLPITWLSVTVIFLILLAALPSLHRSTRPLWLAITAALITMFIVSTFFSISWIYRDMRHNISRGYFEPSEESPDARHPSFPGPIVPITPLRHSTNIHFIGGDGADPYTLAGISYEAGKLSHDGSVQQV